MFGMGKAPAKAATAAKKTKAGRKELVAVTVRLEPRQRDQLVLLGGDAWLREQIERASAATSSP